MICTIILDAFSGEILVKNKRDCRILLQSLPSLPNDIIEYINLAKNETSKKERLFAYTALFSSLKALFNLDDIQIVRGDNGKPYLLSREIHFNISHSNGLIAVAISDEGRIGVDVQGEIEGEREKRLKNRFLRDVNVKNESTNQRYFILDFEDNAAIFTECDPFDAEDCFTGKWTASESLIKLSGDGFSSISKVNDISKMSKTETVQIFLNKEKNLISTSIYKKNE